MYNDHKVEPLHVMLPKTSNVERYDGQTKWMFLVIEDDGLIEKYTAIWDKASANIKRNLIASLSAVKNFWKPK